MLRVARFPFVVALVACFFPMLGSALGVDTFHMGAFATAGAMLIVLTSQGAPRPDFLNGTLAIGVFAMFGFAAAEYLTGRGFVVLGGGGYVVLLGATAYALLRASETANVEDVVVGLSRVYKLLVGAMLAEIVLLLMGLNETLAQIFPYGAVPGYRARGVQADIPRLFGLFGNGAGVNSLMLGNQSAAMVSLFAAIWFFTVRDGALPGISSRSARRWAGASVVTLLFSLNGTALIMIMAACVLYLFFIVRRHRLLFATAMLAGTATLYFLIARGLFLQRIFSTATLSLSPALIEQYSQSGFDIQNISTIGYYILAFQNPLLLWASLDWTQRVWGTNGTFFQNDQTYISGDFGFFVDVVMKTGLIWTAIFLFTVIRLCVPGLRLVHQTGESDEHIGWVRLASVNSLIGLLWLLSTIHYNQATGNAAGVVLFGLHLAVAAYAHYRARADIVDALPATA